MGTSNLHNVNASSYYSIGVDDEMDQDQFEVCIYYVKEQLEAKCKELGLDWYDGEGKDHNELRSFPSRVLGQIRLSKEYTDYDVEIRVTAVVRSGYYQGGNLDWSDPEYLISGDNTDEIDFAEMIEYVLDTSRANSKRLAKFSESWARTNTEVITNALDDVYEACTTPLVVTGRFSDGTTIFEKKD
jgi:hypothetical protein